MQRCVRGEDPNDRALVPSEDCAIPHQPAHGNTKHRKVGPKAEIGLDQNAQPKGSRLWRKRLQFAGGGARPAFELVSDHARAAAHIALGHRPAAGAFQRRQHMRLADGAPVHRIQPVVTGLGDDRQNPAEVAGPSRAAS